MFRRARIFMMGGRRSIPHSLRLGNHGQMKLQLAQILQFMVLLLQRLLPLSLTVSCSVSQNKLLLIIKLIFIFGTYCHPRLIPLKKANAQD